MSMLSHDAFTLHDSHSRRSRTSPSPRARIPSPFAASSTDGKTRRSARRNSKAVLPPLESSEDDRDAQTIAERLLDMNGDAAPRSPVPSSPKPAVEVIDWEIPRKILHSSIGFATIYLYTSNGSPRTVVVVLCTALAVIAPTDMVRLRNPAFARVYERFLGFLMRESEKEMTNGVIWYLIGCGFVLSVFPLDIATVSIIILSWADTAASTFGRMLGRRTGPLPRRILGLPFAARKSLAGFMAATLTGALIAVGFWGWLAPVRPADVSWTWAHGALPSVPQGHGMSQFGLEGLALGGWLGLSIVGVVAGLVTGVAEALDLGTWDDNMTLPIITGGCLWGLMKFLGLFRA
ncbi:hypothetical protein PLICRDRAFT_89738 [Plicaturopsis crispa FD-325 SS-3]|nr:hypothetical protein PLICRDRAFT_89738 [Plicaturopsis crispa FD-325 SS-3]